MGHGLVRCVQKTGMFILSAFILFATAEGIRRGSVAVSSPSPMVYYYNLGMVVGVLCIVFGWFGEPKNKD